MHERIAERRRVIRQARRRVQHARRVDQAVTLTALLLAVVLVALVWTTVAEGSNRSAARAAICDVFGPRCATAMRVASCETGGTFDPRARGSAGERGLFQIHPVHFGWLNERRLYQRRYNARIAFRLSRGGRDWGPWTCRP